MQYTWNDGVFSVALGVPSGPNGDRQAYFHPMASTHEFAVNTRFLKDSTAAARPTIAAEFKVESVVISNWNYGFNIALSLSEF